MSTSRPGCLTIVFALFGGGRESPIAAESLPYRLRDDFLSPAERSFYGVLATAVRDQYVVCPKVNMADVLFVVKPNENLAARNRIDRKHFDFVLCDPATLRPQIAIELDDSSHGRPDRQRRDDLVEQVCEAAGLPLVRFPVRAAYTPAELREMLDVPSAPLPRRAGVLPSNVGHGTSRGSAAGYSIGVISTNVGETPICPKCGVPMVPRTASRGSRPGETFWGCPNFPKCRETAPVTGYLLAEVGAA